MESSAELRENPKIADGTCYEELINWTTLCIKTISATDISFGVTELCF